LSPDFFDLKYYQNQIEYFLISLKYLLVVILYVLLIEFFFSCTNFLLAFLSCSVIENLMKDEKVITKFLMKYSISKLSPALSRNCFNF